MAKLDKNKWLVENPYEFIERDGNLFVLDSDDWTLQQLPDNSATKFLSNKLRRLI